MRKWITTDSRNTPSTTKPVDEETVDAPGDVGKASMPGQVKRPNPWGRRRKKKKMMMRRRRKRRMMQETSAT